MPAHSGSSHGWIPVHWVTAKRMHFTTVFILLNVHLLHTCVRVKMGMVVLSWASECQRTAFRNYSSPSITDSRDWPQITGIGLNSLTHSAHLPLNLIVDSENFEIKFNLRVNKVWHIKLRKNFYVNKLKILFIHKKFLFTDAIIQINWLIINLFRIHLISRRTFRRFWEIREKCPRV